MVSPSMNTSVGKVLLKCFIAMIRLPLWELPEMLWVLLICNIRRLKLIQPMGDAWVNGRQTSIERLDALVCSIFWHSVWYACSHKLFFLQPFLNLPGILANKGSSGLNMWGDVAFIISYSSVGLSVASYCQSNPDNPKVEWTPLSLPAILCIRLFFKLCSHCPTRRRKVLWTIRRYDQPSTSSSLGRTWITLI